LRSTLRRSTPVAKTADASGGRASWEESVSPVCCAAVEQTLIIVIAHDRGTIDYAETKASGRKQNIRFVLRVKERRPDHWKGQWND
jgi:hypothetical protein